MTENRQLTVDSCGFIVVYYNIRCLKNKGPPNPPPPRCNIESECDPSKGPFREMCGLDRHPSVYYHLELSRLNPAQQYLRRSWCTSLDLLELLWRSRARRKVPVEFYSQLTGRENKLCTVIGCAPTRQGRGRERWVILLEDINSYPEMCAEHVLPRSTSTPSIPVSAFFTAFFHSRARASPTGRVATVLEYGYF